MRLVLDTNVIVSGILWGGVPRQILKKAYEQHTPCFSLGTLSELKHVLEYPKFQKQWERLSFSIEEFIERLTERALVIANPPEELVIKEDPADNKFLACATACHAKLIVSGDEHLRALKKYKSILIKTPRQALKLLR